MHKVGTCMTKFTWHYVRGESDYAIFSSLFVLKTARRVWKDYFPAVDAVVFLIDSCDRARHKESRGELDALLADEQIASCPVLILGNKIDHPGAASEDELRQTFGLYSKTTGKVIYFTITMD